VSAGPRRLAVLVDGTPMPEPEALAFWERFSTWMEEHRGDLAGFAAQEGFASVHPGVDGDRPVLRASKTAGQRPYAPVRSGQTSEAPGGSHARHGVPQKPGQTRGHPRDRGRKPPT
jgi:hypothetical protein